MLKVSNLNLSRLNKSCLKNDMVKGTIGKKWINNKSNAMEKCRWSWKGFKMTQNIIYILYYLVLSIMGEKIIPVEQSK